VPASKARNYDLALLGATGFTGQLTARYLAAVAGRRKLRWAIAGRNPTKLEGLRRSLAAQVAAHAQPDVITADVDDAASLTNLAQNCRVLATTVGPYLHYGAPVVAACAEAGTDYVDLTGEPEFVDRMRADYDAVARQNAVRPSRCLAVAAPGPGAGRCTGPRQLFRRHVAIGLGSVRTHRPTTLDARQAGDCAQRRPTRTNRAFAPTSRPRGTRLAIAVADH